MLRKALTLGMVFILALSLLAVSMITCFTYDAEAGPLKFGHQHWNCTKPPPNPAEDLGRHSGLGPPWSCTVVTQ